MIRRNELKLRLSPELSGQFLETVQKHLPVFCYRKGRQTTFITTVYFDTEDLRFYNRASRFRHDNLKLRLKEYYYHSESNGGAEVLDDCWVETKRRLGKSTTKHRLRVPKEEVSNLLKGEECFEKLRKTNTSLTVSQLRQVYGEIEGLVHAYPVKACAVTNYRRRTFQRPHDESVRITVDDQIAYFRPPPRLYNGVRALTREELGQPCGKQDYSVIEIKLAVSAPPWLNSLLRGYPRSTFSKFLTSTQSLFDSR